MAEEDSGFIFEKRRNFLNAVILIAKFAYVKSVWTSVMKMCPITFVKALITQMMK